MAHGVLHQGESPDIKSLQQGYYIRISPVFQHNSILLQLLVKSGCGLEYEPSAGSEIRRENN